METKLKELYEFIVERSLVNKKTTVEDICTRFPNYYTLNQKESNYSNSPKVYEDIDLINELNDYDTYIIVKDNNNFKVGNREEVISYAEKLKKHALKQLKKYWLIIRRIKLSYNFILNVDKEYEKCYGLFDENNEYNKFAKTFIDSLPPIHYSDEALMKCSIKQLHEYTKSIGGYVVNGWNKQDYINEIRLVEKNAKSKCDKSI